MLLPTSAMWLARDPREASPDEADRAVAALRSDYERWSRWAWGLVAFPGLLLGVTIVLGVTAEAISLRRIAPIDLVLLSPFVGMTAGCGFVLVRLHLTGRRLASGASAWLRRPGRYRGGHSGRDWLQARTVNLEPPVLARLVTATLALLLGIAGTSVFLRDVALGLQAFSWSALGIGVVGLAAGAGQAGGVFRLVSGLAEHDPIWARIRGRRPPH